MAVIAYQYRGELVDQIHRGHIAVIRIVLRLPAPPPSPFRQFPWQRAVRWSIMALPRRSWPSSAPPITGSPFM